MGDALLDRHPSPWRLDDDGEGQRVVDRNGAAIAYVSFDVSVEDDEEKALGASFAAAPRMEALLRSTHERLLKENACACYVNPRRGTEACDIADMLAELDAAKGGDRG